MDLGELPHMAVADSPGQARQGSHSRDGRPADPLVSRAGLRDSHDADGRAAHLTPPDLVRFVLSEVVHSITRRWPPPASLASSVLSHAPIAPARGPRCGTRRPQDAAMRSTGGRGRSPWLARNPQPKPKPDQIRDSLLLRKTLQMIMNLGERSPRAGLSRVPLSRSGGSGLPGCQPSPRPLPPRRTSHR